MCIFNNTEIQRQDDQTTPMERKNAQKTSNETTKPFGMKHGDCGEFRVFWFDYESCHSEEQNKELQKYVHDKKMDKQDYKIFTECYAELLECHTTIFSTSNVDNLSGLKMSISQALLARLESNLKNGRHVLTGCSQYLVKSNRKFKYLLDDDSSFLFGEEYAKCVCGAPNCRYVICYTFIKFIFNL